MTDTVVYPDLAGAVALVTGGSRGIGAATAAAFAANDVAVVVVGRDLAALENVADSIRARGGRAVGIAADCTDESQLDALREQVHEELGPIDICCPFAGGDGMPVPTANETAAHWRRVVESDLTSSFLTISAFLADLAASRRGVIVTMASAAARQAARSSAAYAAAKAGVIALSRHLAAELVPDGIRVNCLAPSAVENDNMRAWLTDERRLQLASQFPLGRIGQPVDVAAATLFLASDASSWITGVTLDVSGGKVML
jgi:3-oxoacyl-[acyl-carrier protein] reductase